MNTPAEDILTAFVNLAQQYPAEPKIALWKRTLTEQQPCLLEIQTHLDQAARALSARLFPDRWAEWIIYLLEALQDHASDEDYRSVLLNVSSAIETRILEEQW